MSTGPAIAVAGLRKRYGKVQALGGVTFEVPAGTVTGLLGPNGAGKTTVVRILATLLAPDAGTARVVGFDVLREPGRVRDRIGLTGQYSAVDGFATGRENLLQVAAVYRMDRRSARRRADELLDVFRLGDVAERRVDTYSGGLRRRLDLAASLVGRPAVLFLDEPTTGLDPRARLDMWSIVRGLVADGTTVLLTTQYLEEADELAGRIVVLNGGVVIADGTPAQLKTHLGGARLLLRPAEADRLAATAAAVSDLGSGAAQVDEDGGAVILRVGTESDVLVDAVRRLDHAGIRLAELTLTRPTLDEVFLSLTEGAS